MQQVLQVTKASRPQPLFVVYARWRMHMPLRKMFYCALLILAVVGSGFLPSTPVSAQSTGVVGTYNTGLNGDGAEIIAVRGDRGVLTNAGHGSIDILDLSNLPTITLIRRVQVPQLKGLTSVAIHPNQDYFIAVAGASQPAANPVPGTASFFRLSDGVLLKTVTVGIQPDSVAISPDGNYAVVANEAEALTAGDNGGNGSLTLLNLAYFYPGYWHTVYINQIALPSLAGRVGLSTGRTDDIGRLPIDNTPGTLEPEFVAFSADSQYAYITLQENNAIVRLHLCYHTLSLLGVGQTTHEVDITPDDGPYVATTRASFFREPDGIDVVYANYQHYLVTADEGDTRDGAGNTGPRGGRTVSIFSAGSGAFVADTGAQIDKLAVVRGIYPDGRSNRGGAEPEGIDGIRLNGRTILAVGLERANAVAFIDMTNPYSPWVYDLVSVGTAPEGVKLVLWRNKLYALTANEGNGTLSVVLVPGMGTVAADAAAVAEETGADITIESMPDFVVDDLVAEVTEEVSADGYKLYLPLVEH